MFSEPGFWMMIAGAALVVFGFLGLVFAGNNRAAINPDSGDLVPRPRCRRCRSSSIHRAPRPEGKEMSERERLVKGVRELLSKLPKGATAVALPMPARNAGRYSMAMSGSGRLRG
jgi:hypothetical protein